MEAKISEKGMNYYVLNEEDVNRLNKGVDGMQHVKGMLSWDLNTKYLLVPGTGSYILKGTINESDDVILGDYVKYTIYR